MTKVPGTRFWKLGIIGWPLGYSLSPLMHTAALKAAGLKGEYEQCPIKSNDLGESVNELAQLDDLEEGIRNWQDKGKLLDGFNVTMPFKSKAYVWVQQHGQIISGQGAVAHAMHVINTVKIENRIPFGYNTDTVGFLQPLKDANLAGTSIVLLGAGGAARTIAAVLALQMRVGRITLFNRSLEHAEKAKRTLETTFQAHSCNVALQIDDDFRSLPIGECKLLINATPMGQQSKDDVPLEILEQLGPSQLVYDIVYEPRETKLIQEARKRGCTVITGDEMLAAQGAAAFEIWTGVPATKTLPAMKKTLDEHFAGRG